MSTQDWIYISSKNGLLPDGTKPLSEPMLTNHYRDPVAYTWGQAHKEYPSTQDTCPLHDFGYYKLKFIDAILNANELNPLANRSELRPTKSAMYICLYCIQSTLNGCIFYISM